MKNIAIITGASSGLGLEFTKEIYNNLDKYKFEIDEIWIIARSYDKLQNLKYTLEKDKNDDFADTTQSRDNARVHESRDTREKNSPTSRTQDSANSTRISRTSRPRDIEIRIIDIDLTGTKGVSALNAFIKAENKLNLLTGGFNITLLINNAGFGTYGEFRTTPIDRQMEMIELNCTTLTGLCGICLPFMKPNSTIINVASLAAFLPLGNFAVYAATKSYVLSFSVALAAELKDKNIHVHAVCPGSVSTNFANVASNGARKEVLHGTSAAKTVKHALKSASKKRYISLYLPKWKFTAFMSRFVGRFFGARYTFLYNKRPSSF